MVPQHEWERLREYWRRLYQRDLERYPQSSQTPINSTSGPRLDCVSQSPQTMFPMCLERSPRTNAHAALAVVEVFLFAARSTLEDNSQYQTINEASPIHMSQPE